MTDKAPVSKHRTIPHEDVISAEARDMIKTHIREEAMAELAMYVTATIERNHVTDRKQIQGVFARQREAERALTQRMEVILHQHGLITVDDVLALTAPDRDEDALKKLVVASHIKGEMIGECEEKAREFDKHMRPFPS